jgi:prepilin-type N-terminal cleavage/methylation domain-containing protein
MQLRQKNAALGLPRNFPSRVPRCAIFRKCEPGLNLGVTLTVASFEQDTSRNLRVMKTKASQHSLMRHGRSKGFTLVELMIVVAIVAILTTIAYPNYRDYVIRGQLVDATQGLSALRANLERYFQDNRTYAAVGPFTPPCSAVPYTSGRFTFTCVTAATTFVATAVGTAAPLTGFTFTVNELNAQATVVTSPPAPTAFLGCATAWITKTGGC